MQFPVGDVKSSRKVTRPFTPHSLWTLHASKHPQIPEGRVELSKKKAQTWQCDIKSEQWEKLLPVHYKGFCKL